MLCLLAKSFLLCSVAEISHVFCFRAMHTTVIQFYFPFLQIGPCKTVSGE